MRAALVLLLAGAFAVPSAAQEGREAPFYAGRPLVEVLQDLNHRGLRIVFSTSLVSPALRVSSEPSGTPREILDQILKPHGLFARPGAQGLLVVTRAPKRREDAAPPAPVPVARPPSEAPPARTATEPQAAGDEVDTQLPSPAISVTVATTNPVIDVQTATVATNFAGALLHDVPNQRDVFALLAQTPGITMPRPDVGGNTAGTQSLYRAYGLAGQSITTVDGVNITSGADDVGAYIDYGALSEATVAAAGNSAEVPVAGAAVATVIKTGSNLHGGELYADVKPANDEPFDGAENYARYRDLNAQLGGPLIKNRLWYFTSFRDQSTELTTAMFDKPPDQGGMQGQPFTTRTTEYTVKVNQQLSVASTLTFMAQLGEKYQPNRFGSGPLAFLYPVESTALQDSWSHIGKAGYTGVIGNRATLDASFNVYGNHFPLTAHTDKTPIIDDVTFARSGAYNTPGLSQDSRQHVNTTLTFYPDRHDIKIGYMYLRYAPTYTAYGAPGPANTAGHFYISTTNGVPTSFWTDNGPTVSVNVVDNHAMFFQDKFQLASKLTLNYGLRFDQSRSSYPAQRFGISDGEGCEDDVHCDVGPFAVSAATPARDVVTFNMIVPRIALIYDVFGNSKTALKGSWGRFATNPAATIASLANPIDITTRKYAWDGDYLTMDPAIAATRITPAYVATLRPIFGGGQLTPTAVDPNLKDSYIDEFTLGAEQQIAGDVRAHVMVVRKQQRDTFGRYDRLHRSRSFTPVAVLDPGPDGAVQDADDRIVTVWETRVPADVTDYYLTNKPVGDSYATLEFGVSTRMRNHWQMASGVDWTTRRLSSEISEDPNTVTWGSNNTETRGWTLKASGSYEFSHGVLLSVTYNAMKGEPYGRLFTVTDLFLRLADPARTTPLIQGNMTILAEKVGTYYLPAINLINLRAQKEFVIRNRQRLHLMANIFNLTNAETVTGVVQTTGRLFQQPRINISGTVFRFGARYMF